MLLLITGATGAGKTTVREALSPALGPEIECFEFAQLVNLPPRLTLTWRHQSAETMVRHAAELARLGRHLLFAGDPLAAGEALCVPSAPMLDGIAVLLLDLAPEAQAERLNGRGDDPSVLVHHQRFAEWMRGHADDPLYRPEVITTGGWSEMRWERLSEIGDGWGMEVLETSTLGPVEVALEVGEWAGRALSGAAPVMKLGGHRPERG